MSIDATITAIERDGVDRIFKLGPFLDTKTGVKSEPGQQSLRLIAPACPLPPVGSRIWGGGAEVLIDSGDQWRYDRVGYSQLKERKGNWP
jgi:hypothetical protein